MRRKPAFVVALSGSASVEPQRVDVRTVPRYPRGVSSRSKDTWGFRLAPRRWPSLFRAVRESPDDVVLGAKVFFSLGGHDEKPTYRRFMRTDCGSEMVGNRTAYPVLFTDYDALRALPDGTLGREYVRQLDERGIHPNELSRLTDIAYEDYEFSPDHAYVRDRVREAHDLYHTLTGYGVDLVGEAGVMGFTLAQTGNKGWAMLALLNTSSRLVSGRFDGLVVAIKGYRRGRRARFLAAVQDWDRLLRTSIEDVREELGITPMDPYRPIELGELFRNASKEAS
ncbi:MAG: hypothetical protein HKN10_02895 [Myxococcales bacterium]|nr:hypothetical protein [Myxococcales bacterium]